MEQVISSKIFLYIFLHVSIRKGTKERYTNVIHAGISVVNSKQHQHRRFQWTTTAKSKNCDRSLKIFLQDQGTDSGSMLMPERNGRSLTAVYFFKSNEIYLNCATLDVKSFIFIAKQSSKVNAWNFHYSTLS